MPTTPFLNMFGRSPIQPLEEHMAKVHACVKELMPFFTAVFAEDWQTAEDIQQKIVQLENAADALKRDLRLHLPKNLFMPVSRSDLLDLLNVQDLLANKARDIAGVILGRQMGFPPELQSLFHDFLKRNIEASQLANTAIHELDELLETGFSGNEIKHVENLIRDLLAIEHDTDEQAVLIRRTLFGIEERLSPVNVIFLYRIIEWTGNLADVAREVGDRLESLVAR